MRAGRVCLPTAKPLSSLRWIVPGRHGDFLSLSMSGLYQSSSVAGADKGLKAGAAVAQAAAAKHSIDLACAHAQRTREAGGGGSPFYI